MKREEEIEKMSNEYADAYKNEWWGGHSNVDDFIDLKLAVEYGVDWADKHPRNDIIAKHVVFTYPNIIKVISDKNDNVSCHPFFEDIVENATITFNNDGNITVEGDFWQYGFFPYDEYLSNIEYQVHPEYIEKTRFLKKDIVRVGWHRKLENKHKSIIVKNYTIIKEN